MKVQGSTARPDKRKATMDDTDSACSLDRTGKVERLDEIAAFASEAFLSAAATETGVLLRLKKTEASQARLRDLIDAERRCCPFLSFEVRVAREEVWLEVGGPPDVRPRLRAILGSPAVSA